MLDREELPRLPRLAPSFALFGAAAGFFTVLAFGAFHYGSQFVHPGVAALAAALSGALFGALLRRSDALRSPFIARENLLIRLGVAVAVTGALAGLGTATITLALDPAKTPPSTLVDSTIAGTFVGAALLPACAVVFRAALRSARARDGSLVSRADRGRVRLVLFTTLSILALGGLPAIALDRPSFALGAQVQFALSLGLPLACAALVAWSALASLRAERELRVLARTRETCAPAEARDAAAPDLADLGLGDEHWSQVRVGHAYRGAREGSVVLRGNVDEARAALRENRASALRSLVLSTVAAAGVVSLGAAAWVFATPTPLRSTTEEVASPVPRGLGTQRPVWIGYFRATSAPASPARSR